jgi:hypothetical protein
MSPKKQARKAADDAAANKNRSRGFTDEERAAMKERARELRAEARRGADKPDGEGAVLAKIADMPEPIAPWPNGSMRSSRRAHQPSCRRPGTGCPRMPWTGTSSASIRARRSSRRGTRHSTSATRRPRRRRHVADLVRSDGVDRRQRGKDRCAREESGELKSHFELTRPASVPSAINAERQPAFRNSCSSASSDSAARVAISFP